MKSNDMQQKIVCFLIFLMLSALPAYGMEAMEYFNLGLEGDLTYKKIEYFTKALELNPRLAVAYGTRSKVNWEIGRDKEAYADHRKAVNLDPRIPRSWGKYPPVESMRGMGLIVLIGIAFVLIFGLKFKPPDKNK
jgi:tetratricopeptide (TPR) repeat protein